MEGGPLPHGTYHQPFIVPVRPPLFPKCLQTRKRAESFGACAWPWRCSKHSLIVAMSTARYMGRNKLERYLSKAGVLSRKESERKIRAGKVFVNGTVIVDPNHALDTDDQVELDGFGHVTLPDWTSNPPRVVLYNKPPGVVTSLRSPEARSNDLHLKALQDVLPEPFRSDLNKVPALRPVGRLDAESVGLLLFTDSSYLGNSLLGQGSCKKEYLLRVSPLPSEMQLSRLREGVKLGKTKSTKTMPCDVSLVRSESGKAVLRFLIQEGRNRQLRRMCKAVGLEVGWLMRTRVGPFSLGSLQLGEAREATAAEKAQLDFLKTWEGFFHSDPIGLTGDLEVIMLADEDCRLPSFNIPISYCSRLDIDFPSKLQLRHNVMYLFLMLYWCILPARGQWPPNERASFCPGCKEA